MVSHFRQKLLHDAREKPTAARVCWTRLCAIISAKPVHVVSPFHVSTLCAYPGHLHAGTSSRKDLNNNSILSRVEYIVQDLLERLESVHKKIAMVSN